jgi:PBP1b-binding outer membrane lipoprotein LpoB
MSRSSHSQCCATAVLLIFAVLFLSLVGCAGREPAPTAEAPKILNVQALLVVPFKVASERYEVGSTVRCSMCGTVFITGPSSPGNDEYMTNQLLTYLKANTAYTLIPPGAGQGVRAQILAQSLDMPERDLLLEMGRKLGADAVISGTIFRFRQRVGTSYAADTTASVAFSMYLLRVADGAVIWSGHFDETQQPLSENLLQLSTFLKRGGAFLTAEQLAQSGLNKVMATFPVP